MDWQTMFVALAILAASFYAGIRIFAKAKSFTRKNECGADCGCEGKQKRGIAEF